MNAPEAAVHSAAQMIPLLFIAPSHSNPRKRFNQAALDELTESVQRHGVIQPVLVRPLLNLATYLTTLPSGATAKGGYELVAGERRYRAAKAAGLKEIPAVVRALTDVEALELQVVENLQRSDLHPIEEAEGYESLMKLHGYAAEDLAAKIGKSKAYIYARLKLSALTPKSRDAFYADKLNPSTALLLARIPVPALQDQALEEITFEDAYNLSPMSVRRAAEHLQEHYMLRLTDAPFPVADEKLLPKAGACGTCPKRTGNQPELFSDVKSEDVCTDPHCFDAKKAAHIIRIRDAAIAKGQTVISGKEAKKIARNGEVEASSGYIRLDARNYSDLKQRTYRQILGKNCPQPTLLEAPSGALVEIVARKDVSEHLKEKLPSPSSSYNDDQKKREAKARLETSIRSAIFEAIADKHPGIPWTPADAALIAGELFDRTDHECVKRLLKRWEPEAFANTTDNKVWSLKKRFAGRIRDMAPADLVRLMIELALASEVHVGAYDGSGQPLRLMATAERIGVDHAAIRAGLTKETKAKKAAKTAKSKPVKKTKPAAKTAAKSTPRKSTASAKESA